ncbi:MAG: hypothetical protein ACK5KT_03925 [Dysgonomonas sp.]
MKKSILFSTLILMCYINIYSQEMDKKQFYSSILLEKTFMLNDWFGNKSHHDVLESASIIDIAYRLDWRLYNGFGIWGSYGIGILGKAEAIPSDLNLFGEINLNDYYIKDLEKTDKSEGSKRISIRGMIGVFYKYKHDKWIVTPYLGMGFQALTSPELKYTLKGKGNNDSYDIRYRWFDRYNEEDKIKSLGFLYLQVKGERKISSKISLSLGVSYSQYLTRPNFTAAMVDHYDQSLIRNIREKGNFVNSLGVSLGVGFW